MLDSLNALSTYLSSPAADKTKGAPAFLGNTAAVPGAAASPNDFTSMLSQLFSQTTNALSKAETASVGALKGTVPIQEAVLAVSAADQSLQTAIAIRDKITAAYTEFSRMAI